MELRLRESLPNLVETRYRSAKASGDLTFSETELCFVADEHDYPWQVRFCPALSSKPVSVDVEASPSKPKFDPFAVPSPELLISSIPNSPDATHNLILNKYPIIPNHFILSTKAYAEQDELLEARDLEATYAILKEWPRQSSVVNGASRQETRRLFAFFNSGEHSGASQAHRHLQFLPVEDMTAGTDPWELYIDWLAAEKSSSDFAVFTTKIPSAVTAKQIHEIYLELHKQAHASSGYGPEKRLSYNLALTTERMAICPRRAESAEIGSEGLCSFNGTSLAGTLLVRTKEQYQILQEKGAAERLSGMLRNIGFAPHRMNEKL